MFYLQMTQCLLFSGLLSPSEDRDLRGKNLHRLVLIRGHMEKKMYGKTYII